MRTRDIRLHLYTLAKSIFSMFDYPDDSLSEMDEFDTQWLVCYLQVFGWMDEWVDFIAPSTRKSHETVMSAIPRCMQQLMKDTFVSEVCERLERRQIPGVCPASVLNVGLAHSQHYGGVLAILNYLDGAWDFVQKANIKAGKPALSVPSQPSWPRRPHSGCTSTDCNHATEDTSKIVQLHKCDGHDCPTVVVPVDILDNQSHNDGKWQSTAWDIRSWDSSDKSTMVIDKLLDNSGKFMAISHGWSDGTGIGTRDAGQVNSCLLDFWIDLARQNGCDGIWWDTISLPKGKEARDRVIKTMDQNYQRAHTVLVYDDDFAHSPWSSVNAPTSILVGLVLSNWFTRGWTAVEFAAATFDKVFTVKYSPEVKHRYTTVSLKDFQSEADYPYDTDYGFETPVNPWIPPMAHLSALNLLRLATLRHTVNDDLTPYSTELSSTRLESLIRILQPRHTAKPKDRMAIPLLMWMVSDAKSEEGPVEIGIPQNVTTPADMTKALVLKSRVIPRWALFHGTEPFDKTTRGPWSQWCPKSIFEFGNELSDKFSLSKADSRDLLAVTEEGVATGWFCAIPLDADTAKAARIKAAFITGKNAKLASKIRMALKRPETCALLLLNSPESKGFDKQTPMAVLVQMLGRTPPVKIPRYKYPDDYICDTYNRSRVPAKKLREPEAEVRALKCRLVGTVEFTLPESFVHRPVYCTFGQDSPDGSLKAAIAQDLIWPLPTTREKQLIIRHDACMGPPPQILQVPPNLMNELRNGMITTVKWSERRFGKERKPRSNNWRDVFKTKDPSSLTSSGIIHKIKIAGSVVAKGAVSKASGDRPNTASQLYKEFAQMLIK